MPRLTSLRSEILPMTALATPVVVAEVGWVAMQMVDTAMVGRIGPEAIGAVGVGSMVFFAVAVPAMAMLLGLDTLIAQAFGAGRRTACDRWLRHGLCLALGLAVPLVVVASVVGRGIDRWGIDPAVQALATPYYAIITWSLIPLLIYAALRQYLQALAIVTPIMVAMVTANVVNALANWVLVFGNLGAPALGVEGAGWATCVSRVYMAAVLACAVWRHRATVWPLGAGVGRDGMRRLAGLGWPVAAQRTLEYGAFAAASLMAAWLAPVTLAAHHIVTHLAGLTFMVPLGVSAATAVRVGHGVGRRDLEGATASGWTGITLGAAFMTAAAVTFISVPRPILGLFTPDAEVVAIGVTLLVVAAVFQIFDGLQVVATGALRGIGDTRTPMLLNLAGHWGVGLPVGYMLCFVAGWGVIGLWIGLSVGLILVGLVLLAVWHRRAGAWLAAEARPR